MLRWAYRHQFAGKLSVVVSVADLLNSQRDRTLLDTPTLNDIIVRRRSTRTATLALSWAFGGTRNVKDPQFDYSNNTSNGSAK